MNEIVAAYTIGNQSLYDACVSIQSLIANNTNNKLKIYIVIDNLFKENNFNILDLYKKCKNVEIVYLNVKNERFNWIKKNVYFDEGFYSFKLPLLIKEPRVLYLSPYTLINDNLSELFNLDMQNHSCLATEQVLSENYKKEWGISHRIVNNNVLLIDTKKWINLNLYNKIKEACISVSDNDSSISTFEYFNKTVDSCGIIDFKYNFTDVWYLKNKLSCSKETKEAYNKFISHITAPVCMTFTGPKPIEEQCKNSYLNLWWEYAEKTPIYNEIKEYRKLNKYKLSTSSAKNSFKYTWLLSRIFPYIKPYWFRILIGFLIAIPLGLLDGVTALALKPYMDYVIGNKEFAYSFYGINLNISSIKMAFIIPIGIVLFAALQGVLRYLNGYFSTWTSQRITNDVKFDLFKRLIHMHPQFFDDNSSGIVISRYMGDPGTASAGIIENIKTITTSLCSALGLIAVMVYSSWKLAFIGILVLLIAFVPVILIRNRIKETSNKNMVISGKITTNINETYSGNKVMAAYGLQDRQNEYFQKQIWNSYNIGISLYKRAGWMSPMMYQIASFGIAAVLGVGTYLINTGQMTPGAFASFVTSLLLLYKPVKTLGNTLTSIQNIFVAMGRVFELFDLEPAIQDCKNPLELKGLNNHIDFKDVTFEYTPNIPVLKNINLKIKKNETLAIVGNSGGGKSTLVSLLPRFYDIKSGSIEFDSIDIKKYSLKSLRNNISMVFQDNFLFSGSIKENIMMGNPDATTEELMEAIKAAHLEDMIQELPEGLETKLGERGLTLSGGQRQRVAIARAILRNAPIVILDEATSALDNESEAIVQKAMNNLMQNRTVFIIAHRLSTIKNADRIAVINEGKLVEIGKHEELLKIENGHYKTLYEMQFKKEEPTVKHQ